MLTERQQLRRCECRRSKDCQGAIPTSDGFVVAIDGRPKFACPNCRNYIARKRK